MTDIVYFSHHELVWRMAAMNRGQLLLLAKRPSPCAAAVFWTILQQRLHLMPCLGDLTDEVLSAAAPGAFDVRSVRRALVWLRRRGLIIYGRAVKGRFGLILLAPEVMGEPRRAPFFVPRLSTGAERRGQGCPIRPSSPRLARRGRVPVSDPAALRAGFSQPWNGQRRHGGKGLPWVSAADVLRRMPMLTVCPRG